MPAAIPGAEGRGFVRLNAGCPRLKRKGVNGLINAIRSSLIQSLQAGVDAFILRGDNRDAPVS